jgi:uncharacterized protein (DUF302 family)
MILVFIQGEDIWFIRKDITMALGNILSYETEKPIAKFVADLEKSMNKRGFIIHNKNHMALKETYDTHEIDMPEGFDLHMLQLCKPEKSSEMLKKNLERVSFLPKFINVWTGDEKTQVRMLQYDGQEVAHLLNDEKYGNAMAKSFASIAGFIEEAL